MTQKKQSFFNNFNCSQYDSKRNTAISYRDETSGIFCQLRQLQEPETARHGHPKHPQSTTIWQNTNCGGNTGVGMTKAKSNLQDTKVFESPESTFCNVIDGIVAQAQHVQPPEVCQAPLVQPR